MLQERYKYYINHNILLAYEKHKSKFDLVFNDNSDPVSEVYILYIFNEITNIFIDLILTTITRYTIIIYKIGNFRLNLILLHKA